MSKFSDAFRRKVTISAALSAMLYSEELSGKNTLATRTQIAIENIHSDLQMLATVDNRFDLNVTEDDALNKLLEMANSIKNMLDLLPDEAAEWVIQAHQKREFQTQQDAQNCADLTRQRYVMARQAALRW